MKDTLKLDRLQVTGDLAPPKAPGPFFILALAPVMKDETSFTVKDWYSTAQRQAAENGLHFVGLGAEGDSKVRKILPGNVFKRFHPFLSLSYPTFNFAAMLNTYNTHMIPSVMFPDGTHLFKS